MPRQVAMYLVKELTQASLPEIGRAFGGKHHTTVIHSINKIDAQRSRRSGPQQDDQQPDRLIPMSLARFPQRPSRKACGSLCKKRDRPVCSTFPHCSSTGINGGKF